MPATPTSTGGAALRDLLDLPTAAAATSLAGRQLTDALARGDDRAADEWRTVRGQVLVRRGHLDDGLADLELVTLRAPAGTPATACVHTGLVDCHLARGDLWRAHHSATPITRVLATPRPPGPDLQRAAALHALGDLARAERDHAAAWRHFLAGGEALGELADHPALLPWRLEAATSAVQLGLRTEARELVDTHVVRSLDDHRPSVAVRALRVRAALAGHGERLALLERAVALVDREDTPRLAALVLVDEAAHLLLSGGDQQRVSALLHDAEDIGRRFGITTTVTRVVRMRSVLGEEVVPPAEVRGDRLSGLARRLATAASAGADDEQIAEELGLTPGVVRRELADVCRVLGIRTRRRIGEAMTLPPPPRPAPQRRPQPAGSAT